MLVGLRASETDAVALSVLALLPAAKVIAFSGDARQAYVHEMRPHRAALIDVSPQALIDAIRGPSPTAELWIPPPKDLNLSQALLHPLLHLKIDGNPSKNH